MMKRLMLCAVALAAFCAQALTETVNGIKWNYTILNGKASIVPIKAFSSPAILKSITNTVVIPSMLGGCPVTSIGNAAFYGCEITDLIIPNSVVDIERNSLGYCYKLQSVKILDGADSCSIHSSAFSYCKSLTSVTIPDRVTVIKNLAFEGCRNLLDTNSIPGVALVDGWVIYGTGGRSHLNLADVRGIADRAFSGNASLVSVSIGNRVKSIDEATFAMCESLTSVTIGNGIKLINDCAFIDCHSLESVGVGNSLESIGGRAFSGCRSLKSMELGNNLKSIGNDAFAGCKSLERVVFGNSLESIGNDAFMDCINLKNVTLPNSVVSIGKWAFNQSALESVIIPHGVTKIEDGTFCLCQSLTSVIIPNSIKSIGEQAFYSSGLKEVKIPGSVTYIGDEAFHDCDSLYAKVPISLKSLVEESCAFFTPGQFFYNLYDIVIDYYDADSLFPEISVDSEIKAALEGAADTNLTANITNVAEYAAYRKWALGLKDTTEAEVKQSPLSWLSYALDTDKLIASNPKEEDLKINDFKPVHNVAEDGTIEFELSASIDEIKIGDGATKDNLKKIFKIWGAETLEGLMNKETRQEVEPSTAEPSEGKVKFKYKLEKSVKPKVERFFWFFEIDQGIPYSPGFQA